MNAMCNFACTRKRGFCRRCGYRTALQCSQHALIPNLEFDEVALTDHADVIEQPDASSPDAVATATVAKG